MARNWRSRSPYASFPRMSEFVDYGKRSIDLPSGCKDLIDVLTLEAPELVGPSQGFHTHGGFVDVETHIEQKLHAAAKHSNLLIQWGHASNNIQVVSIKGQLHVLAFVQLSSTTLGSVRAFFSRLLREGGKPVTQTVSAQVAVIKYELPGTAQGAAGVICDLLEKGFGIRETARLEFFYVQK